MYRNQVKMVGGFLCEMSLEERNRWTEFIQSQDEFLQYCILKNKLDKVCEIERIEKFTKELNIIETKLYELGKEWCKNNIKFSQDRVPLFDQLKLSASSSNP